MMIDKLTIALAGNPNSGKTRVFNALTGARQHVGNYPGVTVERSRDRRRQGVPSTWWTCPARTASRPTAWRSWSPATSSSRAPGRGGRHRGQPRTWSATSTWPAQLMELGVPLVLAFNMSDVAKQRGHEFDLPQLSPLLGVPIVTMVGRRNEGIEALLDTVLDVARGGSLSSRRARSLRPGGRGGAGADRIAIGPRP